MGVIEAVIRVVIERWARWVGEGWVGAGWLGAGDLGAGVLGAGIVGARRRTYAPYAFWTCQAGSRTGLRPSDGGTACFILLGLYVR